MNLHLSSRKNTTNLSRSEGAPAPPPRHSAVREAKIASQSYELQEVPRRRGEA